MDSNALNWRGVVVFGLAVLTVIVLIAVIDDEPATLGINTAVTSQDGTDVTTTTVAGTPTTTVPGAPTTTKPGTTATTSFNPATKPQLQAGSTDTANVTFLQETLKRLGVYTGAVDGSFGAGTTAAVIQFQTSKGITPADGVVGPATWTALSTA